MDYLWTPWRYQYIAGIDGGKGGCVFCELPGRADEEVFIVHRGKRNYIVLNRFPYTSGHAMVIPYRHFAGFGELEPAETQEMMDLARALQGALVDVYHPEGFNVGWNLGRCAGAGVADHLHLHVVPRWVGDTNLVGVLGETRTLPEDLETTCRKLKERFSRL